MYFTCKNNRRNGGYFKSYLIRNCVYNQIFFLFFIHIIYRNDRGMLVKLTHLLSNRYRQFIRTDTFQITFLKPPNESNRVKICAD